MDDEQHWDDLLKEQSALFRKTIQKNAELETRVLELERELSVWKLAFSSNDEEKAELKKKVTRLERNIGSLKDDNPLVLCLIDGDGNIFSQDLVKLGRSGGSQAAQLITKGIIDCLSETDDGKIDASSSISRRAQIWVSVYCNKSGLQEALTSRQLCTVEQFEAFIMGFNQASPLFSLTDVGNSKEAADTKIKECLRVFTRFPQTSKVFFGGGHDNGYVSTLNSLNNESLLDKIILLRGYKEVAFELKALKLPSVEFEGVFMTQKLPYLYHKKPNGSTQSEPEKKPSRGGINSLQASPSKPQPKARQQSDASSNFKFNPPACNFYYLAVCKAGTACRYGHDYDMSAQDLTIMRVNAKKSPCGLANRNQRCEFGDRCPLGHICPTGAKCKFFKVGKCKFVGDGMHDAIGVSIPKVTMGREGSTSTLEQTSSDTRPVTPGFGGDGGLDGLLPPLHLDGGQPIIPWIPPRPTPYHSQYSISGEGIPESMRFFNPSG